MGVDRLANYLAAAGLAAREAEIRTFVAQGAQDVHAIMTSRWSSDELRRIATREIHPPTRGRQVTGIMWYLTALAVERNQGFVAGAFLCLDPHGRLSAFFRAVGKPRTSSHLKRHSAPGCTGGVDLHADGTFPPLAHGHRQVLFIAIVNDKRRGNCLFLNLSPTVSLVSKTSSTTLSATSARSRVDRFVKAFAEAVAHLPDGLSAIAEVGSKGVREGIGGMHDYLTTKIADAKLPEPAHVPLATLLQRLESEYDFVALRFGNEVCLDLAADLSGPLPQAPEVLGPSPPLW
ncbi:hypothetical protein BGZ61DRAFT_539886 [Ilyonectria robusta]|uniref:uncharacterized protein n=1 Tax=Ilyonectria robusta TaxID=1079257 RepID=UPI001E8CF72D|nr:uncharacterized protein BGZ61DRAFT_539886 [Ilyonectria robusta]KAH8660994.1 hypothetical protein BGZ61DRAFT_539886 [Ilyonectria robusta]